MSDPQPEDTRSEKQPWPPAPIQGDTNEPAREESPQGFFTISLVVKGFGMGIAAGPSFSLIAIYPCLAMSLITKHANLAAVVLALPLAPELLIACRLCRYQKALGVTFGIVSIAFSVLIEIAMLQALAG